MTFSFGLHVVVWDAAYNLLCTTSREGESRRVEWRTMARSPRGPFKHAFKKHVGHSGNRRLIVSTSICIRLQLLASEPQNLTILATFYAQQPHSSRGRDAGEIAQHTPQIHSEIPGRYTEDGRYTSRTRADINHRDALQDRSQSVKLLCGDTPLPGGSVRRRRRSCSHRQCCRGDGRGGEGLLIGTAARGQPSLPWQG